VRKYDFDVREFWQLDAEAHKDNCFNECAKQVAFGIRMSDECVFAELGEDGNPWGITHPQRLHDLRMRYNDKAEKIVGIRLLSDQPPPPDDSVFPGHTRIGEIFGGKYTFTETGGWWLDSNIKTPQALEKVLNDIDKSDLRERILPKNWEAESRRIAEKYGTKPAPFSGIRGPVTLAMSILGVEELIYLISDEPDLARRFSQTIARMVKAYVDVSDAEIGRKPAEPRFLGFWDDNCCMLNAGMYEAFGYPVLKDVFDYACPSYADQRYQHSDSDMAHILPLLGRVNLTACNFGPTVMIDQIRKYMPKTRIDGALSPMVFLSNDEEKIMGEVRRDCEFAKAHGRGVSISAAGSINNGTLLTSMRAAMYAVVKYGRY